MTMLKVRRGTKGPDLVLRGRTLPRGSVFDSSDFADVPALNERKWIQLQEQGLVELVDPPGRGVPTRAAAEQERAHAHLTDFAASLEDVDTPCPESDCDYVAKNAHGLKVHVGRRHTTKEP